jgi:GT2 family glycosyltransferase
VRVSALIVTWNNERSIRECVRALQESRCPPHEILVFDNASMDATPDICRKLLPENNLFSSSENVGFAAGVNFLARRAIGQAFLLVNPDAYVRADAIGALCSTIARRGAAVVGGFVDDAAGNPHPASARPFTPSWRIAAWLLGGPQHRWRLPNRECTVDAVSGALMLVRSDAWRRLAGFDEGFLHSGEDLDFCWRAQRVLLEVATQPRARARHDLGASVRQAPSEIEAIRWEGVVRLALKREGATAATAIRLCMRIRSRISIIARAVGVRGGNESERRRAAALNCWARGQSTLVRLPKTPDIST